jgi:hypothetical protein
MVTRSHQKIEDDESSFLSTLCRKDLYLAANHQHQRFPIIQDRSAADRARLSGDQMARNLLEPLDRFFLVIRFSRQRSRQFEQRRRSAAMALYAPK